MASVLIIDDYPGTRETYSTILRRAGFHTATAATGQEGIARAKGQAFDVILVDLQLPDIVQGRERNGASGEALAK